MQLALDVAREDVVAMSRDGRLFDGRSTYGWAPPAAQGPGRWHVHVAGETLNGGSVRLRCQARRGLGLRTKLELVQDVLLNER
jgi:hypothetical protein